MDIIERLRKNDYLSIEAALSNNEGLYYETFDKYGDTLLMLAVDEFPSIEMVATILREAPKDAVNMRSSEGLTALHYAVNRKNLELVTLLINSGAEVSPKNNAGYTPLHSVVSSGHLELVKLLLEAGADLNSISKFGTPLDECCDNDELEEMLRSLGAKTAEELEGVSDTSAQIQSTIPQELFAVPEKDKSNSRELVQLGERLSSVVDNGEPMTDDEFWDIINTTHAKAYSKYDPDEGNDEEIYELHVELMAHELAALSLEKIRGFQHIYHEKRLPLYHWNYVAAAAIVCDHISDDAFADFCSWVITQGQDYYNSVLQDPENLGERPQMFYPAFEDIGELEELIMEIKYGEDWEDNIPEDEWEYKWPDKLGGKQFEAEELPAMYPKLWKLYGE